MKTNCPICNNEILSKFSEKEQLNYFYCPDCKIGGKAKTKNEALENFLKNDKPNIEIEKPKNKNELLPYFEKNMLSVIRNEVPFFIKRNSAERMIRKNVKYIFQENFEKVWETEEGRDSIVDALNESFYYAATLPDMGSVIPFRSGKVHVAEFIPARSAFESILTHGEGAPFTNIYIDAIYENDIYDIGRVDGDFRFEMKKIGFPRGEIIGVVVQAEKPDGKKIGEAYDTKRLLEKAEQSSTSYQYYLKDMHELKKAQAEGKDYILKWEKKFYAHDITNPYANANKPEMLKKLAGKSFLWPFVKIRHSQSVSDSIEENENAEQKIMNAIDGSVSSVKHDIIDAEFFELAELPEAEKTEPAEPATQKEKAPVEKEKNLFGGEKL